MNADYSGAKMIPAGYMAKRVVSRPDWLKANQVESIYSVSGCFSECFTDYIGYWKHNGYWFFNSPEDIQQIAEEASTPLSDLTLFYYEIYEQEFCEDSRNWSLFSAEPSLETNVITPHTKQLAGYDVATYSQNNVPECSPLSCNSISDEIKTNEHCLLSSFQDAINHLESGVFNLSEPGPFRIIAVYTTDWPDN